MPEKETTNRQTPVSTGFLPFVVIILYGDLSRLGRNYIEVGQVIENFFPQYGVRYIAIGDSFDSAIDSGDIVPFKNILNEMYSKDISQKTKSAKRNGALQGRFLGSHAPYGYKKSPENKHLLIPDDEVSMVIKEIFELFVSGQSARAIADEFNKRNLPTPSEYRNNICSGTGWGSGTVIQILDNLAYIGHMVQGKRKNLSYKSKKRLQVPKKDWIFVKHTHKPLIDEKIFLKAEMIRKTNSFSKRTRSGCVSLFAGVCFCAECGFPMVYTSKTKSNGSGVVGFYKCSGYVNKGSHFCKPNQIREDYLLAELLEFCKNTLENNSQKSNLHKFLLAELKLSISALAQEKKEKAKKINELEKTALQLLKQNKSEIPLVLGSLFANIEKEMEEARKSINYIENQLQYKNQKRKSADNFVSDTWEFLRNPIFSHENIISIFEKIIIQKNIGSTKPNIEAYFRV